MSQTKAQLVDGFNINTSVPADSLAIDSSGNVGIGTTSPADTLHVRGPVSGTIVNLDRAGSYSWKIGQDANSRLTITADTSQVAAIDTSGRLLVGTSSSRAVGYGDNTSLLVEGTSYSAAGISAVLNSNNANGPNLNFAKTRGTSNGSNTVVQSDDNLGVINFSGGDGTDVASHGARIQCQVDGTPGANDMPGRLVFSTTADGASSPMERMRIGSSGGIDVSATGNGDNHLRATASQTTVIAANVYIDATTGVLRRSTSSIKYKTDVETLQDSFADEILKCRPVWYRSTSDYDNQQWGYWGFIAEEVAEIDPRLCFYGENEDGSLEPDGVQYDRFVPHLLNLIKRQKEQIKAMEARLTALESA